MKAQKIDHMFNFTYVKSSTEIVAKARDKRAAVQAKVTERAARITRIRDEYGITDIILIDLLAKARNQSIAPSYSYSNTTVKDPSGDGPVEEVTIGAGVINGLLTERDFIEAEKSQVEKLDLIIRNLQDLTSQEGGVPFTKGHELSHDELQYLGF